MTPIKPATAGTQPLSTSSARPARTADPARTQSIARLATAATTAAAGTAFQKSPSDAAPSNRYAAAVAGAHGAPTALGADGGTATLDDVQAVGIFTDSEMAELAAKQMTPEELGEFRDAAVEYAQQTGTGQQQVQLQAQSPVPQQAQSVAPAEPAASANPTATATLDDIASLGILNETELTQLASANYSPEQLGAMYDEGIAYIQSAQADPAAAAGATAPAAPTGAPAWDQEWFDTFKAMLQEQGIDSKTRMAVLASLKSAGLDEAGLQQYFDFYANTPEGAAKLQEAEEQVAASAGPANAIMLSMGGAALGYGAVTGAVGASRSNMVKALERTVASASPERAAAAAKALEEVRAGRPLTTAMRAEIVTTMRAEAAATNRALHPVAKASLNGAARHVTPSMKLSGADALKYGLWMKHGDAVTDAARAASTVAGGADDAAKAASGAAQAAKGASWLGKAAKFLGPVGLIASAGIGAFGIAKTVEAEGEFGEESSKMTGSVVGGLAGGMAGAAAFATAGALLGPIGAGAGAIVGGVLGSIGLSKVGEGIGGFLHGLFD